MAELTHFNEQGRARMVDVTEKAVTHRRAVAAGEIHMAPETLQNIKYGTLKKGDVLAVAQVAGIQAAKHNWELIPMSPSPCPIPPAWWRSRPPSPAPALPGWRWRP